MPHLEGHDIAFNASDRKSWKRYARSMDEYLRCELTCQRSLPDHFVSHLVNPELPFIPLPPRSSRGMLGEEAPFVGRALPLNAFFFSPPSFTPCFLSALFNQRPEAGSAVAAARVY